MMNPATTSDLAADCDYRTLFRLDGRVALVTGGARGLGAESARALAQSGTKVFLTDVDAEAGEATAHAIAATGAEITFFRLNVTDENQWETAIATVVEKYGSLDVLLNNAGKQRITCCRDDRASRHLISKLTGRIFVAQDN